MSSPVQEHDQKSRSVWNSPGGRYDEISRSIADAIEHAVERLRPEANARVLDLATGTGWASRIADLPELARVRTAADVPRHPRSPQMIRVIANG